MLAFAISGDLISGGGYAPGRRSVGARPGFSPVGISAGLAWDSAGSGDAATRVKWQAGGRAAAPVKMRWQPAPGGALELALPWRGSEASAVSAALRWREAVRASAALRLPWQGSPKGAADLMLPWRDAAALAVAHALPWWATPRGAAPLRMPWHDSQPAALASRLPWGKGRVLADATRLAWQRAGWPSWGIIIIPPPDPGDGSGGGDRDPFGSWRIYIRSSYHMLHDVSLVRLPERTAIPASRLAFVKSADSPHIAFNGVIHGRSALDACIASGGMPVELEASIDGQVVVVALDPPKATQAFSANSFSISGRSLSWYVGWPFQRPRDRTSMASSTAQQLAQDELPSGWSLSWVNDWPVPTGALSYRNLSPIQAIQRIAAAAGHMVVPSLSSKALAVRPRYPIAPWNYASATPQLIVPAELAFNFSKQFDPAALHANAVYVAGGAVGGVLGRVWRSGTAGDRLLAQVQDDLIVDADAAYWRGIRELARDWEQPIIRQLVLPMDGGTFPLADLGWLVRVDDPAEGAVFGSVASVAWSAELKPTRGGKAECIVRQTLALGEDSGSDLARFGALTSTQEPLLYAEVIAVHGTTATVQMPGGGVLRVRAEAATVGSKVFVRAGKIDSPAPDFDESYFDLEA